MEISARRAHRLAPASGLLHLALFKRASREGLNSQGRSVCYFIRLYGNGHESARPGMPAWDTRSPRAGRSRRVGSVATATTTSPRAHRGAPNVPAGSIGVSSVTRTHLALVRPSLRVNTGHRHGAVDHSNPTRPTPPRLALCQRRDEGRRRRPRYRPPTGRASICHVVAACWRCRGGGGR